ncbi:MAG: stalk domain-containing protein, partial [Rhodanobacteraceae bacterium]
MAAIAVTTFVAPASAQQRARYIFEGKPVAISQASQQNGRAAVAIDDPGLGKLLNELGATVTWQPGERYVLITTAEPVVVSFAIGDPKYDVGPVAEQASFAPFVKNGDAYVPLDELLRALDLAPKRDGGDTILQPQLASIDIQSRGGGTKVVAHAGIPLDAHVVSDDKDKLVIAFDGVGTTLEPDRRVQANGLRSIDIQTGGSVRQPRTIVTLSIAPGTSHGPPSTDDQRDFTVAFGSMTNAQPPDQTA